jgi:uncharacterized MAPEG superfamily protein
MTFALWTILAAAVLPLLCAAAAKSGGDRYDNNQPRIWESTLTGWRARANWAHRNHYEAFGPFAAAVLTAHWAHAQQGLVDALAGAFILVRLGYTGAYIADRPSLRSILWAVGFACVVLLFCAALL